MADEHRPLSPHLQVYRLPLTVVLSITHRITGAFLGLGALLFVYVLVAAAGGAESYAPARNLVSSWIGQLFLLLWTFSLYFHLCNGIRHLLWDAGYGYDLRVIDKSSYLVIVGAIGLTLLSWGIALA